ncbi:hypothetical protein C8Q74DRAFT_65410 [Fomes fomentarius]|nr:hypothetical protein C8Q74DRAFT_65410 [Fomes fomentarius]
MLEASRRRVFQPLSRPSTDDYIYASTTRSLNCLDREVCYTFTSFSAVYCRVMSQNRVRISSTSSGRCPALFLSWQLGFPPLLVASQESVSWTSYVRVTTSSSRILAYILLCRVKYSCYSQYMMFHFHTGHTLVIQHRWSSLQANRGFAYAKSVQVPQHPLLWYHRNMRCGRHN